MTARRTGTVSIAGSDVRVAEIRHRSVTIAASYDRLG